MHVKGIILKKVNIKEENVYESEKNVRVDIIVVYVY